MDRQLSAVGGHHKPKGLGPAQTTLAQSLQDFGRETLPFLKGAVQECNRINKYLRGVGLATLKAVKLRPSTAPDPQQGTTPANQAADGSETAGDAATGTSSKHTGKPAHFRIDLVPVAANGARCVPRGLKRHREELSKSTAGSDQLRARLARLDVDCIARHQVQELMNQLRKEGLAAASLQNERALLRGFWNHAFTSWQWTSLRDNVASQLKMPQVKAFKARVMTQEEQVRLHEALAECRNDLVEPTLVLLRETAMRTSEPIDYARWCDVDWEGEILHLKDSKTDARDVPLSADAIVALRRLQELTGGTAKEPVVAITYESLKAAWRRACERAGIDGLRLYDLRHTAATRAALQFGNVWLVQALTGHKTLAMVERYTHVSATDLVKAWKQADVLRAETASARLQNEGQSTPLPLAATGTFGDVGRAGLAGPAVEDGRRVAPAVPPTAETPPRSSVIAVDFKKRRAG